MFIQRMVVGIGLLVVAMITSPAYAHKVNLFAYAEGDQVYVQGYFSDGTQAKNSDVTVYGADGRELLKGQTDEQGAFTFASQGKGKALRLVLNAGLGHQASFEIPGDEMGATAAETSTADSPSPPGDSSSRQAPDSGAAGGGAPAQAQLTEAAVRKAVAEGVLPLAREISALKERRGFSDIIAGIGFIVGLLGVFAYVKARQVAAQVKKPTDGPA